MYKWKSPVWALLFLLLAMPALARSEFKGKVVGVADGDTITVLTLGNRRVKVRLYGVDCPEKKQAFGQRARQFTAQRIAGEQARVEVIEMDRYGRSVGIVYAENGQNLNRELLEAGMAWVYPGYCKVSFCKEWERLEAKARSDGVGLWMDRNPIPPWEWRRARKRR